MSITLRRQFLLSVVRSKKKAWTAVELCDQTGLREPVLAADLAELCAGGAVKKGQTAQARTFYFAEGVAC
ncbi:hypothetical protein [Plesiomonas shigelloides]|uniref:hypothetical protein n=1 Tax=Plesiomonas shigelloides TaxID=703 RepID=UPI001E5BD3F3|nr:hypothetical protein [Plesiomonas shigelloides]